MQLALRSTTARRHTFRSGDAARELAASLLDLVEVDAWSYTAFRITGEVAYVASSAHAKVGKNHAVKYARLGAPLSAIEEPEYPVGLAAVLADDARTYGVLTLFRTEKGAAFATLEREIITLAVTAAGERLRRERSARCSAANGVLPQHAAGRGDKIASVYVVDPDLRVILGVPSSDEAAGERADSCAGSRLPRRVEDAVRDLVRRRQRGAASGGDPATLVTPSVAVRAQPLSGRWNGFIAVHVEAACDTDPLASALGAFRITPRETETLACIMDGLSASEAAERLVISPSTVQDHIRSLLAKTGSANRAALVARVLGWRGRYADAAPAGTFGPSPGDRLTVGDGPRSSWLRDGAERTVRETRRRPRRPPPKGPR